MKEFKLFLQETKRTADEAPHRFPICMIGRGTQEGLEIFRVKETIERNPAGVSKLVVHNSELRVSQIFRHAGEQGMKVFQGCEKDHVQNYEVIHIWK